MMGGFKMRKRTTAYVLACLIVSAAAGHNILTVRSQSSSSPVSVGRMVATTVDDMDIFDPTPPADIKVSLLQVRRAVDAWDLISKASAENKPPKAGFEYVLALIKFEYSAREGTPRGKAYELSADEFTAASPEGNWYDTPSIVLPRPILKTKLISGESSEGWAAFLVPREDKNPRLFFMRGNVWFQLYNSTQ
jgi:hypothetical protein